MGSICDHTSVGVILENKKGEILLIERAKFPPGFAPPAGHIDDHCTPQGAAQAEVAEEVGLQVDREDLEERLHRNFPNQCRREDGTWHEWWVYEARRWGGRVRRKRDEAKRHMWVGPRKLRMLIAEHKLDPAWEEIFELI